MAKVLVIEDNNTLREGIVAVLKRMGHDVNSAANGKLGLEAWELLKPDLVLTDLKMDKVDGMTVLRTIREKDPDALVMIVTAFGSIERAVEAMKEGAFDFIPKPFPPDLLRTKVTKALEVRDERREAAKLRDENAMLRQDAAAGYDGSSIVGSSEPMRRVFTMIDKVGRTDSTVHVFGESGTGKELVARAIHESSGRAKGPFVKVNCSALAETLLESELFGHEKGAFTGASARRMGRFELADGGTLFLDEIGDIGAPTQLKLLRVLQEREFERVGSSETVRVDVRVVTATNKDLKAEVEAGRFREDLFYRLHIIPMTLPSLRERTSDIPDLAAHFVEKLARRTRSGVKGVGDEAMGALMAYEWPGNVRELENVIERAMVFAEGDTIALDDLPPVVAGGSRRGDVLDIPRGDRSLPEILEDLERQLILRAYREAKGVKTETARLLGIKPSALYYKLDKYDVTEDALD